MKTELFDELKETVHYINSLKDDGHTDVEKSLEFLLRLQKSRNIEPPPLAEVITIIKYEKPILHSILKKRLQSNLGMKILFELELDYRNAKNKVYGE